MITFLVVLTAALAVLAVTRARRRREVLIYAWLMPASTVVQAVIGGITVLTGLLWWTVAIHLLASMTMVWVSVLLYVKIGEPDNGTVRTSGSETVAPVDHSERRRAGRGARHRHPGHRRRPARRRQEHRQSGAAAPGGDHHAGASARDAAGCVPVAAGRAGLRAARGARTAAAWCGGWGCLLAVVAAQGLVGTVQYVIGVPAALVAIHVAGAAACTAATAALWASMRERAEAEPLEGCSRHRRRSRAA